jgi:hypothetical protein
MDLVGDIYLEVVAIRDVGVERSRKDLGCLARRAD